MSKKLYQAGQISLGEYGKLIFDPSRSPQPITQNFCLTPVNSAGKRDWILEFEARLERDLSLGNSLGAKNNKKVLGILNRLAQEAAYV